MKYVNLTVKKVSIWNLFSYLHLNIDFWQLYDICNYFSHKKPHYLNLLLIGDSLNVTLKQSWLKQIFILPQKLVPLIYLEIKMVWYIVLLLIVWCKSRNNGDSGRGGSGSKNQRKWNEEEKLTYLVVSKALNRRKRYTYEKACEKRNDVK